MGSWTCPYMILNGYDMLYLPTMNPNRNYGRIT